MRNRLAVIVVGAGLTACTGSPPPIAPPPPKVDAPIAPPVTPPPTPPEMMMSHNPPAPLPTWDEAIVRHRVDPANPTVPVVVVMPGGASCYIDWESPAHASAELLRDRVSDVIPDGARPVACPDRAVALILAAKVPE